jgi:hypothetical protein
VFLPVGVSYGPILKEGATAQEHKERRDSVAPLEKALAVAMSAAGYDVMNRVNCRIQLDKEKFVEVRAAFSHRFLKLANDKDSQ